MKWVITLFFRPRFVKISIIFAKKWLGTNWNKNIKLRYAILNWFQIGKSELDIWTFRQIDQLQQSPSTVDGYIMKVKRLLKIDSSV